MTRLPALLLVAVLLVPPASLAVPDEPHPLTVPVGGTVNVCKTGTIVCPAGAARCDDPKVAIPERGTDGLVFKGMSPGTTLCSAGASDGHGARRVYRLTVTGAPRR